MENNEKIKRTATDKSRVSVLRQLAVLPNLSLEQLQEKWLDLFGCDAPGYKKQFIIKRLAYRIQELFYGGLSEQAKNCLKEVAAKDPLANVSSTVPIERKNNDSILPGTRFVRIWNDRRHEVITTENGFEYDNRFFKSLSAIAREITGTRWNGRLFFGLSGKKQRGDLADV